MSGSRITIRQHPRPLLRVDAAHRDQPQAEVTDLREQAVLRSLVGN